jgi:hypothetical protein
LENNGQHCNQEADLLPDSYQMADLDEAEDHDN